VGSKADTRRSTVSVTSGSAFISVLRLSIKTLKGDSFHQQSRYKQALTSFMRLKIAKEKNKRTTVVQSAKTEKSRIQGAHSHNTGSGA
jgi:hypothetical protein